MATKKPATKPAAAPAKKAAKAAPATNEAVFEAGQYVEFLGYDESVPANEQVLETGEVYPVSDVTEEGNPIVRFDNPEFNPEKKEHPKTNPATLEVECFPEEVKVVDAPEETAEETEETEEVAEETVAEEPVKPAATKGKGKTAKAAPTEAAPAKKSAAKKTAAKAAPEPEQTEEGSGELVELENEDPEVLALVEGSEDLIGTAQELEANVATTEYQLGGVLRHILQTRAYTEMVDDKGKRITDFDEPGAFKVFLEQYFNMGYRKAMYLIQIYECFTLAGIENPADRVAAIGWTKASKIAKALAEEGANVDELLQLAEENTVEDLSTALKEQVTVGGTPASGGTQAKRITFKFRLWEEEAASVNAILETATEQLGLKDIGEAMAHIVQEWGNQNAGGVAEQEDAPVQSAPKKTAAKAPAKRATAKA